MKVARGLVFGILLLLKWLLLFFQFINLSRNITKYTFYCVQNYILGRLLRSLIPFVYAFQENFYLFNKYEVLTVDSTSLVYKLSKFVIKYCVAVQRAEQAYFPYPIPYFPPLSILVVVAINLAINLVVVVVDVG